MKTKTIRSVAFAFLGPDALRIVLVSKGYHVSMYSGDPKTLTFRSDGNNIVITSINTDRNTLFTYADKIKFLILHTEGQFSDAAALGLPILDITDKDGDNKLVRNNTPSDYVRMIEGTKSSITLTSGQEKPVKKQKKSWPDTYDGWLSLLEKLVDIEDFVSTVEMPIYNYITKMTDKDALKQTMKGIINSDRTKKAITLCYKWLVGSSGEALSKAFIAFTANTDNIYEIAEHFDVDPDDLLLLYSIRKGA